MDTYQALYAPAKTPYPIIKKMFGTIREILEQPAVQQKIESFGRQVLISKSPSELTSRVNAESAQWASIIKNPKFKAQ